MYNYYTIQPTFIGWFSVQAKNVVYLHFNRQELNHLLVWMNDLSQLENLSSSFWSPISCGLVSLHYLPEFLFAQNWATLGKSAVVIFFLCPSLRSVSSRSFLCWWFPSMPALSVGLLPARTRSGPLLPLWRRSHDQVRRIGLLQGLWGQRWGFVSVFPTACMSAVYVLFIVTMHTIESALFILTTKITGVHHSLPMHTEIKIYYSSSSTL